MFKKDPNLNPTSNTKNSERKRLQASIREQYEYESYQFSSTEIKHGTFKTQSTVGTVYTDPNNIPLWFRGKHDQTYIPTVYSCWDHPDLLPVVHTHEHVVESKLKGGADLMLPGTVPPFSSGTRRGRVVGIASTRAPGVVKAVGICEMDLEGVTTVADTTGVAVRVLHTYGDGLCRVFKVQREAPEASEAKGASPEAREPEAEPPKTAPGEGLAEELERLTMEDVDHLLTRAVYYTIKADGRLQLPVTASKFIAEHVLKNLPPMDLSQVTVKRSSWGKAAKLLKHFEAQGLLTLKGKPESFTVVSVNSAHEALKSFEPYRTVSDKASTGSKNSSTTQSLEIVYHYVPNRTLLPQLNGLGISGGDALSAKDIRDRLEQYVAARKCVDPYDKSMLRLDDTLAQLLHKNVNADTPRSLPRPEALAALLSRSFSEYFVVMRGDAPLSKPQKGRAPPIKVTNERKIYKKVVTKVSNFEVYGVDPEELAAELRVRCSGSTTITDVPNTKAVEVQVQGPHEATIVSILNKHGIPSKYITLDCKVQPKKKK
ncbi:AGR079Wp [Eremothecium gossypii ATCC 10895]|uniref:AGR079Wp n=1 Tax=Eremothecium gossypii (strain ATCC 10895 / CBS 109.51 / FGSC 9923 / NRRL Y-1056) TaxID=284811 RepID=Q74ZX9_EREGS|nr:AGR079Wp [Eremothecium gossypii ATCC 10895]AAS54568.2 AGR079Wp [Eremothecium gossypii ATCC 10895]AEY98900.1 FAGR079Wp [Eremothecium gossypii FDAG1]